jgi:hypothetical protein
MYFYSMHSLISTVVNIFNFKIVTYRSASYTFAHNGMHDPKSSEIDCCPLWLLPHAPRSWQREAVNVLWQQHFARRPGCVILPDTCHSWEGAWLDPSQAALAFSQPIRDPQQSSEEV